MFDLNYNVLRFCTVYGPEQPGCDDNGLMIAKFGRLAREEKALTIHGSGEDKRDYIHVSDVAQGIIASMESKVKSEIFNLGTGNSISINAVVDILRKEYPGLTVEHIEKPKGYASETLADISKAKKLLGWEPKIVQADGIRDYYRNITDV